MRSSRIILLAGAILLFFTLILQGRVYEDLYIHCDRNTYAAGEKIFLKAYLFNSDSMVLSGTSSFAYVELLSPLNRPVAQIKILLENGKGSSLLSIPDTIMNGRYILRGYTNSMKNLMPYGCFMKGLTIINPFSNHFAGLKFSRTSGNLLPFKINFHPEGGKMIAGISSKVAIHAFDRFGNPAIFSGIITDNEGNTITAAGTDSTGLGITEFIPLKGMSYTAVNERDQKRFSLPMVNNNGISIHVAERTGDSLELVLTAGNGEVPEYAFANVMIRSRGKVLFSKREYLAGRQKLLVVPVGILEDGLNYIEVSDGSGKLTAGRFIYRSEKRPEIRIPDPQMQYGKREKVRFEISPDEADHSGRNIDFSVSISPVTDDAYIPTMNNYLVFGSGYRVENISCDLAELFFGSTPEKQDILLLGLTDNLIDHEKIKCKTDSTYEFRTESGGQYIVVSGSKEESGEDAIYKPAFITSPGKIPELHYSLPDKKNRYQFFIEKGEEEKEIIIQLPDSVAKTGYKVESPFYQGSITTEFQTDTTRPAIPEFYKTMSRNFQVMKIYDIPGIVEDVKEKPAGSQKTRFYGKPDQELILKNYISLPTMQEVFFELVSGVTIRTNNGVVRFHITDPRTNSILEGEPLILIDGVLINDPAIMLGLNPDRVEKIDIIASDYLLGDFIFPGIINAITKTGDYSEIPLSRNSLKIRQRLFDPPEIFESPVHSGSAPADKRIPDFRNTLFWEYDLKQADDGKSFIEFYTADISSDYIINIAGTDRSGKPVSYNKAFRVR
jgi:hypothetical protein